MQRDFLTPKGRMPVAHDQVAPMLKAINGLIKQARSTDVEVIYIRNAFSRSDILGNLLRNDAAIEGSSGAELDPRLVIDGPVFMKDAPDAFSNPALDARLHDKRVGHLYVVGVFADQCVYWTSRGAINRNYEVTVIPEGLGAASAADRSRALGSLQEAGVEVLARGTYRQLFPHMRGLIDVSM